ncbi:30S ribosomal protein S1 [Thioalkalivibrio versutus]|uniref:30S ribosomal protein S1 n=1 Tax=Thioalkalivibrio versutus TaxID=106634 RepID=A0A0G3G836_9GAMM|nr:MULTISPECIES: 30S ribosomal protein S1 [Thioalkalivibrio]AKJ95036.1 30S ribosomal protein S1 [Thioalkalivibrio versutus]
MSESFAQLLEESMAYTQMQPGAILSATVIEVTPEVVVVNAGLKSEGVIPTEQFMNEEGELEVKVGDVVEVALETPEDGFGETRMSREKAKRAKAWDRLEGAMEEEQYVTGKISGKVKGGYTVELGDIRAFLPGSLVDVRPVRDTAYLEGKELEFKLIKLDRRRNNVVVSRRAVVEQEYSAEREELLKNLQEGAQVKGIVKNLTDYGAFLDLGGIDGLLHITDMAWKRVKHPSDVVEIGQEVEVKVLKFDRERMRVSLGLKQLGEDPWENITRRYPTGTRIFGKVTNITDYGCFVEIEDGVEGLVHVSEMDWTNKNVNPGKMVAIGDEVEVMILDLDEERRRISLGMKQCQSNPWDDFAANHNRGEKVSGQIKSITDFGVFVGLEGGIDGLIHLSDLSWHEAGEEAIRNFKKGDEVEAVVLSVDPERERISLGLKQLDRDPFANFVAEHSKGSIVSGTVKEVDAKAAVIELADGIDGILRAADISQDRVEDASTVLKVGETVEARFMGVDKKTRAISLSIKAKDRAEEAEMVSDYGSNAGSGTTLGDLLKEQMDKND